MVELDALEGHWLSCMASAGGGGRVTRLGGATILTNPQSEMTMLNCILLRNATPEKLADLLEIGRVVLAAYERPPALFLSPQAGDVAALEDRLAELGWRPTLHQVVLVRELTQPLPACDEHGPAVVETADREGWGRLLAAAYEVPEVLSEGVRSAWTRLSGEARYYLAHLEGQPVGTGLTWRQGPIAGLYAGAVLPAFRRRGVERASLIRRLLDARADGTQYATLQTEAGSPVEHLACNRLGFTLAYRRSLWMCTSCG